MKKTCKTCSAYNPSSHSMGTCRANPPQGIPNVSVNPVSGRPEVNLLGGWPPVAEDEWCRNGWSPKHELAN